MRGIKASEGEKGSAVLSRRGRCGGKRTVLDSHESNTNERREISSERTFV